MIYIVIAIMLLILVYILITYNGLVKLNNYVKEAFATMDVYLKKRWDLVPNLVEVVKGYAEHEKTTIEEVTKIRSSIYDNLSQNDKISTNENLTKVLSNLLAIAESYPDLKANQNFIDLSQQLIKIEDDIANSRKYYNAVIRELNNKIEMFPSNIIAKIFAFKEAKMFEVQADERKSVEVNM